MKHMISLQLLTFLLLTCQAQNHGKMIYKNSEIEINFPGSFKEVENGTFNVTIYDGYKEGYFFDFEKKILFHEDDQDKYYTTDDGEIIPTQHVVTSTGYLSDLYIYPAIDKTALYKELKKAFEQKNAKFSYRKVKEKKVGNIIALNWRTQYYKNRFEYYLVCGKKYYYLFISTPYGEETYIENLLKNVRFLK